VREAFPSVSGELQSIVQRDYNNGSGKLSPNYTKHVSLSAFFKTSLGSRFLVLMACTFLVGVAAAFQLPVLSSAGLLTESSEAQLFQLTTALLGACCVSGTVVVALGREDLVTSALESLGAVFLPLMACSAFMVVGPTLMLLNKHIMQEAGFPYPMSLSSLGLLASVIVSRLLVWTGQAELREEVQAQVVGSGYSWIVLPIAVTRAVTLATGNAVYLFLSVGFIQMLKAFTPAIVLLVMVVAQVEAPAKPSVFCVLIIVFGTIVEVNGELHATFLGILIMVTSCVGEAIATVLSQKMLQNLKFSEVETLYYLSPPSMLFLTMVSVVWEWPTMFQTGEYKIFFEHPHLMLLASVLGVGVNLLTLVVVRATSSVTVKILNTFRCIGLVIIGSIFYGEVHTDRQLFGYGVSLVGFVGYNYFQLNKSHAKAVEAWCTQLCSSSESTDASASSIINIGSSGGGSGSGGGGGGASGQQQQQRPPSASPASSSSSSKSNSKIGQCTTSTETSSPTDLEKRDCPRRAASRDRLLFG